MPTYTKDQIIEAVDAFPNELRGVLFSSSVESNVKKIGTDAGLLIDQLENLNTLVNYVILGLLSKEEFTAECKQFFALDENIANMISESISREIFIPNEKLKTKALKEQQEQRRKEEEGASLEAAEIGGITAGPLGAAAGYTAGVTLGVGAYSNKQAQASAKKIRETDVAKEKEEENDDKLLAKLAKKLEEKKEKKEEKPEAKPAH